MLRGVEIIPGKVKIVFGWVGSNDVVSIWVKTVEFIKY